MKTIEVTNADQATPVEVKHEALTPETVSPRTLREMAKIVFEGMERDPRVSDAEIIAQYKEKQDALIAQVEKQLSGTPEQDKAPQVIGAPTGFPETADIEAELEEVGPVATSLRDRLARVTDFVTYQASRPATFIYGKMFDAAEKHSVKLQGFTDEQKEAHIASVGRRSTLATIGVAALYGAYMAVTKTNMFDFAPTSGSASANNVYHTSHGDIRTASVNTALTPEGSGGSGSSAQDAAHANNRIRGTEEYPSTSKGGNNLSTEVFHYNAGTDPTLSPLKHGNDFGPAPAVDPLDTKANFAAMTDSWKKSPGALATVMSKLGLVDNNAGSINNVADQMKTDPKVFQTNYNAVIDKIGNPKNMRVEAVTAPYGSYYAVNIGGRSTIAYDNYVNGSGHMLIIETRDGHKLGFHEQCLYQPSDEIEQKTVTVSNHRQQSSGTTQHYTSTPSRPTTPRPTPTPTPTPQPTPEPTPTPEPQPTPEPTPEPYVKGPGFANEHVEPAGSGDLKTPDNVITEIFNSLRSNTGNPNKQAPTDSFTEVAPTDRSSGVSSQNTTPNLNTSGATSAGDAGNTADGSLSSRP